MCLINSNLGYVYNGFHVRGPNYYKKKPDQVRNRDTQEPGAGAEAGAGADTQRPVFNQQPSGPVSGYKTELGEKYPPSMYFFSSPRFLTRFRVHFPSCSRLFTV